MKSLVTKYNALRDKLVGQQRAQKLNNPIPPPLDVSLLFSDTYDELWCHTGLAETFATAPPSWMSSDDMKAAILAVQEYDRGLEELQRLEAETNLLIHWLNGKVENLNFLLENCGGKVIQLFLGVHNVVNCTWQTLL